MSTTNEKTGKKLVIDTIDILENKTLLSDEEKVEFILRCFSAIKATFTIDEENYKKYFPEDLRTKLEHNKLIRKAK